jgi:hypothetical protein
MNRMIYRHPWIALLGWFPIIYPLGVIRNWDKPWCNDGGFFGIALSFPVFWWPTKLYRRIKWEKERHNKYYKY